MNRLCVHCGSEFAERQAAPTQKYCALACYRNAVAGRNRARRAAGRGLTTNPPPEKSPAQAVLDAAVAYVTAHERNEVGAGAVEIERLVDTIHAYLRARDQAPR